MLYSKFSLVIFVSHLLFFVASPEIHYKCSTDPVIPEPGKVTPAVTSIPEESADKILLNKNAVEYVQNYIENNTESLVKIKQRSKFPFKTMDKVFRKYGLPVELKYLAVIESELKTTAVSRVGAVGLWQLMPATAKVLGLKVSAAADERTQYGKSTKAAALYLRDLYAQFGDWLLVLAAYNCGPAPVYKAIHKSGSHNFWNLQAYLPRESREHVKKFIATHYYFEGQGSVTTLTRAENIRHSLMLMTEKPEQNERMRSGYNSDLLRFRKSIAYGN